MNSKTILLISRYLGLITHDAAMTVNSSMGSLSKDNGDGNANGLILTNQQLCTCITPFCILLSRRRRSKKDDHDSENVTKKMNLRPFKLYRVYLEPLYSSDVGDFSWSRILNGFIHVQIEKGKFVVVCPRPPYNVALAGFTS